MEMVDGILSTNWIVHVSHACTWLIWQNLHLERKWEATAIT